MIATRVAAAQAAAMRAIIEAAARPGMATPVNEALQLGAALRARQGVTAG